jgi:hypothetical protein
MTYLHSSQTSMLSRGRPNWIRCPRTLHLKRTLWIQPGQSLTELAFLVPIVVLVLLGIANLGLAVRAQTNLAQATQQGAQYLFRHPATNPATCTASLGQYSLCTDAALTAYLADAGFPNSQVNTTFGTTSSGVLDETFAVTYTFTLYMPIWSRINVGALHGNAVDLGAQVTTIAATTAPLSATAIRPSGGSQITLTFYAPQPALATPLSLTYTIGTIPVTVVTPIGTPTPGQVTGCYDDGTSQTIYLTAVQKNGLGSASIPITVATPQPAQTPQC